MSALILLAALLAPPMPALTAAKADVDLAEHQAADLATQRTAVQKDLDRLAGEIAQRKASLRRGAEPPQDLLSMLQRSTLLAQQIEALQRRYAVAQVTAQAAQQRLAGACALGAKELEQWSGMGRTEVETRAGLQDSLAQLTKDCSGGPLAREEPAAHAGVPDATLQATPSDDAQRLRQKADFLRDREDRLRRQVVQLDQRILALGRERMLQHRMAEFLQENSLFDEDDRRVARAEISVVPGAVTTAGKVEPSSAGGAVAFAAQTAPHADSASAAAPAPASPSVVSPIASVTRTAVLQRPEDPQLEGNPGGADESLEGLSARRAILAAEADRLHIAALALEQASGPR
jgi:hypothetical protein